MLSELGGRPTLGSNDGSFGEDLEKEIASLLREQRDHDDTNHERELNIHRYGSAPPTVEGSLNAVGGLFGNGGGAGLPGFPGAKNGNGFASEEELRSNPAYLSYYYSNVNLNPRLPPPLLSKEDWRFAQRLKGGPSLGDIGDARKVNRPDNSAGRSLFSTPPGFDAVKQDAESIPEIAHAPAEWGGDGLIGLSGLRLMNKQKSIAEILQDDAGIATTVNGVPSRPSSRNAFEENLDANISSKVEVVQNTAAPSYSYAVGASLSRSNTPDPQLVARAPSPCPTPIGAGRGNAAEKRQVTASNSFNVVSGSADDSADVVAALSALNLSKNGVKGEESQLHPQIEQAVENHQDYLYSLNRDDNQHDLSAYMKNTESGHPHMAPYATKVLYTDAGKSNGRRPDSMKPSFMVDRQVEHQNSQPASRSAYTKGSPTSILNGGAGYPAQYHQVDVSGSSFPNCGLNGFSLDPALASAMVGQLGTGALPPLYENAAAASAMGIPGMDTTILGGGIAGTVSEPNSINRMATSGSALQAPFLDPMYLQYLRASDYAVAQLGTMNDLSMDNYLGNSYMNMLDMQSPYFGTLLSPEKSQYNVSFGAKPRGSDRHGYPGNHTSISGLSYPGSPMGGSVMLNSPAGPGSPLRHTDLMRFSGTRSFSSSKMGGWHLDAGYHASESFASSLLEEFKSNKTKCFELSDIASHVVEFSADQYGSRFIQQKLEIATTAEKTMVYQEIMPQALALMTDVFGNYVIQKFFEHALVSQRRELANKLFGHVLTLSLQMYGCRVIQKAIEVVDLDQKIKMVEELDGHVMRCVRDQNGNHVIQKCIECVPEESIHFIISTFFDQIVTLSTHPYGCRVVQRVLEHCKNPETESKVMDEILGSVSMLAQDQYGNYVIQHVLEHGKPHERSVIIEELAGKIVSMSQQKFASNVVEKCLTFGGPAERQLMVNEMLGTTDENEPLQAMMKDQFANYVVQKVLETCDDQQRELILSRVKVHLNALKKYTYGKHIVARVEKLVAAGERRIAAQSPQPA
ncbi:hypothetical protein MLD38_003970 [Melastoma candidum]|uniref:Uncharacterized protein n=1 Tax=Melastoma candidum TaxID=119954 RepID=A0ACB9S439_9MYRT|nr:hypothetical protein MLD38_003970 [Melastoma candidum]